MHRRKRNTFTARGHGRPPRQLEQLAGLEHSQPFTTNTQRAAGIAVGTILAMIVAAIAVALVIVALTP